MKKLHILFLSILPALVILFCFLGFLAAPNDPEEVVITQSFLAPCAEYPLGTDQYGRCVLSRILYGGYTTLGIVLMGLGYVSHSARRKGRAEEALRTSIEAINPAGAFYSKGARKKAAKDLTRK